MNIKIKSNAVCGKVPITPGEYWVALNAESSQIKLVGKGKDICLPAVKRRATTKTKTTSVQFYCGGGVAWSLVVATPTAGEWLSIIEYVNSDKE